MFQAHMTSKQAADFLLFNAIDDARLRQKRAKFVKSTGCLSSSTQASPLLHRQPNTFLNFRSSRKLLIRYHTMGPVLTVRLITTYDASCAGDVAGSELGGRHHIIHTYFGRKW